MKVSIPIWFEVNVDDEEIAKAAAKSAAYHNLAFDGCCTDGRSVTVPIDGYGECEVSLIEEDQDAR